MKKDTPLNSPSCPDVPTGLVSRAESEPFGYVIGNLDPTLRDMLGLPEECSSIGIVSSKKRSSSMLFAADEAVK